METTDSATFNPKEPIFKLLLDVHSLTLFISLLDLILIEEEILAIIRELGYSGYSVTSDVKVLGYEDWRGAVAGYYEDVGFYSLLQGDEGVVGLKRWFEMEHVFEICKCAEDDKGDDIEAYNNRFHELVLMCPEFVSTKSKKIETYIRGFPERIKGNITSSSLRNIDLRQSHGP
ncbi:hypothetical protein Tco_0505711 [Tanacetum coccineum]